MTRIPGIPVQRSNQPTSLTQTGSSHSGACPSCGSTRLTALAMTLTDGTPVRFSSCHECEHRTWTADSGELLFADVLARATKARV